MELHVALLLPYHDGSGKTEVIGVYDSKDRAEAACYRRHKLNGYDQPTDVIPVNLNLDTKI